MSRENERFGEGIDCLTVELVDPWLPEAIEVLWIMRRELDAIYGEVTTSPPPQQEFQVPRAAFLLARREGRPVGCGAIKPWDERTAEVKRVFVLPQERGRGIGRTIMEALEGKAREFGYERAFLETGDRQAEALIMYPRLGYRKVRCLGNKNWKPSSLCFEKTL